VSVEAESLDCLLTRIRLLVFDFDGVFTDNMVYVSQDGVESVRCWRGDGLGLSRLREVGVDSLIISTEVNPVVSMRASKLRMACLQGIPDKAAAVRMACTERGIALGETAFIGNDINDIPAFEIVGLPISVADAHPEVAPLSLYRTCLPGGRGAVREVCDLVFEAKRRCSSEGVRHGRA